MDVVETIVLAGYLKRYPRLGSLLVGIRESIASHSFRVAYIAFELAKLLEEDPRKYVREALWHDFRRAKVLDRYHAGARFVEEPKYERSSLVSDANILDTLATVKLENVKNWELWLENMAPKLKLDESRELLTEVMSIPSISVFHRRLRLADRLYPTDRVVLAGFLKKMPRSGWFVVGIRDPETVADHVFRTMIIAELLAREEGEDPEMEVIRALLHDLPEALTGDMHKLAKMHVKVKENELWEFLGLEQPEETPILKDADKLELIATAVEYKSAGVKGLDPWIDIAESGLKTETARAIAEELKGIVLGEYYVELLKKVSHGAR